MSKLTSISTPSYHNGGKSTTEYQSFCEPSDPDIFFADLYMVGSGNVTDPQAREELLFGLLESTSSPFEEELVVTVKRDELLEDARLLVEIALLLEPRKRSFQRGIHPPSSMILRPYNQMDMRLLTGKIACKVLYLREKYLHPNNSIHQIDPIEWLRELNKGVSV